MLHALHWGQIRQPVVNEVRDCQSEADSGLRRVVPNKVKMMLRDACDVEEVEGPHPSARPVLNLGTALGHQVDASREGILGI
jgi:hypothetical protein